MLHKPHLTPCPFQISLVSSPFALWTSHLYYPSLLLTLCHLPRSLMATVQPHPRCPPTPAQLNGIHFPFLTLNLTAYTQVLHLAHWLFFVFSCLLRTCQGSLEPLVGCSSQAPVSKNYLHPSDSYSIIPALAPLFNFSPMSLCPLVTHTGHINSCCSELWSCG